MLPSVLLHAPRSLRYFTTRGRAQRRTPGTPALDIHRARAISAVSTCCLYSDASIVAVRTGAQSLLHQGRLHRFAVCRLLHPSSQTLTHRSIHSATAAHATAALAAADLEDDADDLLPGRLVEYKRDTRSGLALISRADGKRNWIISDPRCCSLAAFALSHVSLCNCKHSMTCCCWHLQMQDA